MISVFGSNVGYEEKSNAGDCIDSQWMGYGNEVKEFEKEFSKRFNVPNFLMVDNCSNALYMAIRLLYLPPKSKIVVPSFTWISCASAVILAGHIPIFADVDMDTYNITRQYIDECIKREGKAEAVIVVHYAGLPVDMDTIDFLVVEDAAHAAYSTYKGKHCGTLGDIGCYSFDAIKNLTMPDGGGLSIKDNAKYEEAKTLRYCGIGKSGFENAMNSVKNIRWWEYNVEDIFIRMLPNNVAASIGLAQLKRFEELQKRREIIWNRYHRELSSWVKRPTNNYEGQHSYFTYCIKVPRRDELAHYLLKNDIYTTLRYHPLHLNPIYRSNARLKNCEMLNEIALNIPLHPRLSDRDVTKVIDTINRFGKKYGL